MKKVFLVLLVFCFVVGGMLPVMATGDAGEAAQGQDMLSSFMGMWPIIIILVLFYFMLFRPQQKKEKAHRLMLSELKVGNEVVTIGGICGRVTNINDDVLTIETGADKVKIKLQRFAVKDVIKSEKSE